MFEIKLRTLRYLLIILGLLGLIKILSTLNQQNHRTNWYSIELVECDNNNCSQKQDNKNLSHLTSARSADATTQMLKDTDFNKSNVHGVAIGQHSTKTSSLGTSQVLKIEADKNKLDKYPRGCSAITTTPAQSNFNFCRIASDAQVFLATDAAFQPASSRDCSTIVYSAFLDFRVDKIKIIALTTGTNFDKYKCQVYYPTEPAAGSYAVIETTAGLRSQVCEISDNAYAEFVCEIASRSSPVWSTYRIAASPVAVSIVESDKPCTSPFTLLRINKAKANADPQKQSSQQSTKRPQQTQQTQGRQASFAVCGAPLHNKYSDVRHLIGFIEANAEFGATAFYFYAHNVDVGVEKALRSYEVARSASTSSGTMNSTRSAAVTVRLLDWHVPERYRFNDGRYYNQFAAAADCILRSLILMGHNYLAYVDIDELIVPRKHRTWQELVAHVEETNNSAVAYIFQNFWFKNMASEKFLRFFSDERSNCSSGPYSHVKMIVSLELVDMLEIHLLSSTLPTTVEPYYHVPDSLGMLQHYRLSFDNKNCALIPDNYLNSSYGEKVTKSVEEIEKLLI